MFSHCGVCLSDRDWCGIWEVLNNTTSRLHTEVLGSVFFTSHTREAYGYPWAQGKAMGWRSGGNQSENLAFVSLFLGLPVLSLRPLNTRFPFGGTVWAGFGGVALLEEACHGRQDLRFQSLSPFPGHSLLCVYGSRCELSASCPGHGTSLHHLEL